MAASSVVLLSKRSQKAFIAYYKALQRTGNTTRSATRARYEDIDKVYQRELDSSQENQRAKAANNGGDTSRLQNTTVPVVMPQVEAAVVYQTSVYLTGDPIFGVVASPSYIDEAIQLETALEEQSILGGWARELIMFFRDGAKYNFAPLEVTWDRIVTAEIATDLTVSLTEGVAKKSIWEGNAIRRLDPYNTFVDTRVPPTEVYKRGEYAGYTELLSRIELKSRIAELPDKIIGNIRPAFESGHSTARVDAGAMNYYLPSINPEVSESDYKDKSMNWSAWAGLDCKQDNGIDYHDSYELTTIYCRILPSEFDLKIPSANTPQIYKLLIVNHEHIIYAELQTNAHNMLPIFVGAPLEDGLGYQTKSLATNGKEFQQVATSLMTSIIESRRRSISDRTLYDPSRVSSAHINSANPSAKIPVRPSAYGENIANAVYAFPYREDQAATSMQQISSLLGLANTLNGQNQAQQGQFVKGNKTLHEYESVMDNANGRDQLAAILYEHQVFTPIKQVLKANILQYQGGTSIYNRDKDRVVEVDPIKLRKAILSFRVSDGLTPSSKLLNTEAWTAALQVMGSSPQIASGYNVQGVFSYLMKAQGAKITEYEKSPEQMAYEQAADRYSKLMQLAIEKDKDPKELGLGEAPKPADFNYDPAGNKPSPEDDNQQGQQQQEQPDGINA